MNPINTDPHTATRAQKAVTRTVWIRAYSALWFGLALAAAGQAWLGTPAKHLPVSALLALVGLAAALLAEWVRRYDFGEARPPWFGILQAVLIYHALAGPVFWIYALTTQATKNSDLPLSLYPHLVHAVNRFE